MAFSAETCQCLLNCAKVNETIKGGTIYTNMCVTEQFLERRIEFLRNKMTNVALEKGFTSIESITISQELDSLLNLYDNLKQINTKEN